MDSGFAAYLSPFSKKTKTKTKKTVHQDEDEQFHMST
jgi:hypothetical protein